jgi:putative inorganic carbon (hco3(-)) transporter
MSFTAGVWVVLASTLALRSFGRPVWAAALYMLTFFAAPHYWWWGRDLPDLRYALLSGLLLLVAVALYRTTETEDGGHRFTVAHFAAIGMAVNATFVHFFLASRPSISFSNYIEILKFVMLFFLLWWAIQNRRDFRVLLIAIALGAAYIGYEVTINERGTFRGSRLEGVGAPGADSANSLACLMLVTLPLTGSLFVDSKRWEKLLVAISAPLALNVLLLCNSRGAFLGLIGAGVSFMLIARGATRKRAFQALALGGAALFVLLGDPKILDRFTTTFVGSEDRDNSAASRLEFWKAGLAMLSDYPLGDGGNAFKYVHGGRYLSEVAGIQEDRSLHNGYLAEATSWGVQGLFLQLLLFGSAMRAAYRTSTQCRLAGHIDSALIGICMIVAAAGFLIHSMFGSFLGNEWGFWIAALLIRYSELYRFADTAAVKVPEPMAA